MTTSDKRPGPVAVIGAGPMGLAVAYHLAKAGVPVEVFEAGPVVGGMSATFDFDGLRIERYYHFICTPDQPLFDLLEELGIADKLRWANTRMGYYYHGACHEWGNPLALLKFPHLKLVEKLRYGLFALAATRRKRWEKLDHLDAVTWIKRWLGESAYRKLWQTLFEMKFYHYTPNLSAAWIWTRIRRVGNSRQSLMKEKLGYMEGGSETLMVRLREEIERLGGRVHLLSAVTRVEIVDGVLRGVVASDQLRSFERVVSTIPTPYVPRIMPDLPDTILDQFRSIDNIAVVCIIIKLARPVTDCFWLNVVDSDMDIPGIVEYTQLKRDIADQHIVYIPYYLPGDHPTYADDDQTFFDKARRYLKQINPELQDSDILAMRASRYRHAQPVCDPNFRRKLPDIALPVAGLYAADTSYYYPEDRGISESVDLGKKIAAMLAERSDERDE